MQEYRDLIENAAASLAEDLWNDFKDEMRSSGGELDGLVWHLVRAIGRSTLEKLFARWSDFLAETTDARLASRPAAKFLTVLGSVAVTLPRLRERGSRDQHSPMSTVFDVRANGRSQRVERALVDFGSEQSFQKASARFEEHYGVAIGRTSLLRVVERHGACAEDFLERKLQCAAAETAGEAPLVFVQLDGSMVPTGEFRTARRAGILDRDPDSIVRPREWREVRVGLALRDGAVDPTHVARIDSYERVVDDLFAAAELQGMGPETQVVCTADGGNGLKSAVLKRFDGCAFVLDHAHLVQHLWLVANEQFSGHAKAWVRESLDEIWKGDAAVVERRLRKRLAAIKLASPPRTIDPAPELRRFINYLEEHRDSVNYAAFSADNWLIGSGRCESAHRSIPQARLKIPGATWKCESVNRMLALRVIRANGWWDEYWGQTYGPKLVA